MIENGLLCAIISKIKVSLPCIYTFENGLLCAIISKINVSLPWHIYMQPFLQKSIKKIITGLCRKSKNFIALLNVSGVMCSKWNHSAAVGNEMPHGRPYGNCTKSESRDDKP